MRKLVQGHHAPTGNDRGNAVAIVLLVLAVVSIVGVGLLTQSTMDLKFATSYKSHAAAFNLADGAASLAFTGVPNTTAPKYLGYPVPTPPLNNANYGNVTPLGERGTYLPVLIFQGPITDPRLLTKEELGQFYLESWTAKGIGRRRDAGRAASNAEVRLGRHLPTEVDAQLPSNKLAQVH
jgi:hypothetical protein